MVELNKIYNEDCFLTLEKMPDFFIDLVLTSPPYNNSYINAKDKYNRKYDFYKDKISDTQYRQWTVNLFNLFDEKVKENGVILYNLSYSSENPSLIWLIISDIIVNTNFITADLIIWKKKNAIPNNRSSNKLTRIIEPIFVFCRKNEIKTFSCNKKVKSISRNGTLRNYENIFNFIEARNNDGCNDLNGATFSNELCKKLLNIYALPNNIIYDPFIGIGTTALAAKENNFNFIGSEISLEQCIHGEKRLKSLTNP